MAKVLVGFMGSGKSTIAELLDPDFVDMDAVITDKIGMSIADFFVEKGEVAFRQIEAVTLAELLTSQHVLSTGGGVVTSAANRDLLSQHADVVYLRADFATLYERMAADTSNQRPLFLNNSRADLEAIFQERQAWYEEVATQIVDVAGKSPVEIMEEIR